MTDQPSTGVTVGVTSDGLHVLIAVICPNGAYTTFVISPTGARRLALQILMIAKDLEEDAAAEEPE